MDLKKKMKAFFTLDRHASDGFTLVELIVVIAILAILAGVTVPAYGNYVDKAKMAADQQMLATMNTAFTVACMDNGEYDMTNLSFSPVASNIQTRVEVNKYNNEFLTYFGGGAFQYYDVLRFDSSKGVFVANTVAALEEALKAAVNGTPFNNETVMGTMMDTLGNIYTYFEGGFSLDAMMSNAPQEVKDKFGFGNDMTDEQILEMYVDGYATWDESQREQWKEAHASEIPTIRSNAYVMRFAQDAASSDRTAESVKNNMTNVLTALASSSSVTEKDVIDYYNKLYDPDTDNYSTAQKQLQLAGGKISAKAVVSMATSGTENTTGVSTLGAMYAVAAGFYNNPNYYKGDAGNVPNFANFDDIYMGKNGVMNPANQAAFQKYLSEQAEADIGAYLSAMNYLSGCDIDLSKSDAFSNEAFGYISDALGFNQ